MATSEEQPCSTPAPDPSAATAASPQVPQASSEVPVLEPAAGVDPASHANGDNFSDGDSAFGSESLLSTESLTPSILEYRQLHGRTYANSKTGEYWGPNDERQSEGLDLIHNALTMLLEDKLFLAPLDQKNPGRVLDVGTGSGIWALDFADEFPAAEVYGTDLSPIQPTWVPPNVTFQIDDCLLEWTWPPNHFDFVHMRAMYGSVPDWTDLDKKALKHLKPGGWFEHVEIGCQGLSDHVKLPEKHTFNTWAQSFYAAGDKMGRPFTICLPGKMKEHMQAAGFVNIVEKIYKLPVGGWPKDQRLKDAGIFFQHALERDMEGFSLFALTQFLGWTKEEVLVLVANMRREIRNKAQCPYITAIVVYGQKPTETEAPETETGGSEAD